MSSQRQRPTRAELEEHYWSQPAFPDGNPAGNWTPEELRAYIDTQDALLAQQPRPKPQPRLDDLSSEQLRQVTQARSQTEVDQMPDQFTKGTK